MEEVRQGSDGETTGKKADLVAELRALRKGAGLSVRRVAASPVLLSVTGTTDANQSMARLIESLDAMGDDVKVLALKTAFAVGMREPGLLTERRNGFQAPDGRWRSPDTVENYENDAIEELALRLTSRSTEPLQLRNPLAAPEDYVLVERICEIDVRNGTIAGIHQNDRLRHVPTGDLYSFVRDTPDDYADLIDRPNDTSFVFRNSDDSGVEALAIWLNFHGAPQAAYVWVHCYESLTDLGLDRGELVEERAANVEADWSHTKFHDWKPAPGRYYRVDWEY